MEQLYKTAPGVDLTGKIGRFIRRVPNALGVGVNTAAGTPSLGILKQITSAGGVQIAVVATGEAYAGVVTDGVAITRDAPLTNDAAGRAVLAAGADFICGYAQRASVGATVDATLAVDDILVDPAATIAGLRTIGLGPLQAAAGTTLATSEAYTDAAILAAQIAADRVQWRSASAVPNLAACVLADLNCGGTPVQDEVVQIDAACSRNGVEATSMSHSGPYRVGVVTAGVAAMTRAAPWDTAAEIAGASWAIESGTWTGYGYGLMMRASQITLDTTVLSFTELWRPTAAVLSYADAGDLSTLTAAEEYTDALGTAIAARRAIFAIAAMLVSVALTGAPDVAGQVYWLLSEWTQASVKLRVVLSCAGGATATVKLYNLTDAAYVQHAGGDLTLTTTSATPVHLDTADLVGETNWATAKTYEVRVFTSDATKPATLGGAWLMPGA